MKFSELVVERTVLAWLESAAWQVRNGAAIAFGEPTAELSEVSAP